MPGTYNIQTEAHIDDVLRTGSGLLPICAGCKKIRDEQGFWNNMENGIGDAYRARLSHGICPDCAKRLYPDFNPYDDE